MAYKTDADGNQIWEDDPVAAPVSSPIAPPNFSMEFDDTPNGRPNTNLGSPGSKTEEINSQWNNWGDRWVDTGDTGGSLRGVTTIGEGRSLTQGQADDFRSQALAAGIPEDWLNSFDSRNADDQQRYLSAWESEISDKGDDRRSGLMGGGAGGAGGGQDDWLRSMLRGLGTNGQMNQDILSRRVSNASDILNANRKSQLSNNEAYLASRGLIGDGPQKTANENLESRLGQAFNYSVNDIYANEAENADERMMAALGLAQGLDISDNDRLVDWFNANTQRDSSMGGLDLQRMLGLGNLALGNLNASNNYNLGLGQLDLQSDLAGMNFDSDTLDKLTQYIDQLLKGANISAGGHQGF